MYSNKRVLLIAGGGTLGTYVSRELLRLGAQVEVICPEEKKSDNRRLSFHQSFATEELLRDLFSKKHYHAVVNFIHYSEVEDYKKIHPLLIQNTDQLVFLSSYRVYADVQHPITETAPRLLDVIKDPDFLENEKYAVSKAKCEDYLRSECAGQPWTIVRPVISFSDKRMDILMYSGHRVLRAAEQGEKLYLPRLVRNYTAGLDWAGNSGKLIANLLFKKEAYGEAFTVSSCQDLTWGDVATYYEELIGAKFNWMDTDEYIRLHAGDHLWSLIYDRLYDRSIDNSKILRVTGLTKEDFTPMKEGIKFELAKLEVKK